MMPSPTLTLVCTRRFTLGAICAVVGVLVAFAPVATARTTDVDVFPPTSKPFGQTYGQWSAEWWKQAVRQTGSPGTPFASGAVDCAAMGTRKVVFLVGTTAATGSQAERSCRISQDTALLIPPINGECSQIEGNGSTDVELRGCAATQADAMANVRATLDGRPLPCLGGFRFASPLFVFSPVASNLFGIPATTSSRSVADGYWVMITRLSQGTHTLSFGGDAPAFHFSTDTTYTLSVR